MSNVIIFILLTKKQITMDFLISVLKKYYAFCLFPLRLLMRIISPSNLEKTEKETSESKQSCCSDNIYVEDVNPQPIQEEVKSTEEVKQDPVKETNSNDNVDTSDINVDDFKRTK